MWRKTCHGPEQPKKWLVWDNLILFGVEGRVKMGRKTMEMRGRWDDRWGTIPDYTTGEVAITRKYQPLFLWSALTFQLAFIHSLGRTSRQTSNCFAHDAPDIYNSPPLPSTLPEYYYHYIPLTSTRSLSKNTNTNHTTSSTQNTCFHTTTPHLHIRPDLHHPGNNKSVSSRSARAWRIGNKQQQCQTTTTTTRYPLHHTPAQTHCTVPTAQKKKKKQSDPKSDSNPLPMAIISSP